MLLRPSGLICHSLRSGKITESLLSVNQQSRGSAMASKELYPQITLWFFSQSDPEKSPIFRFTKIFQPR